MKSFATSASALALALAACGGSARSGPPAAASTPAATPADIARIESEVLRDLVAIDARLALRSGIEPTDDDLHRVAMGAVLGEDTSVAIIDGRIDPFSFDARAHGLEAVRRKLPAGGRAASDLDEAWLLTRFVDTELARLADERILPRSASRLVDAIAETWQPAAGTSLAERDRWLARRLAQIRGALASAGIADVVRARDLDDALDRLERLIPLADYPTATKELVRVREALEATGSKPPGKSAESWTPLAPRLRAELGSDVNADALARDLDAATARLRGAAEAALDEAHVDRHRLFSELEPLLFVNGRCADEVAGSRVRSLAAPPEREPSCHLKHVVAKASEPRARAVALAAMHEHLVVASWALDVARGTASLGNAQDKHHRLVAGPPHTRARYERIAVTRPVAAIGAGLTVVLLLRGDPIARSAAWGALGDVPLDVADRALR